MSKHSLIRLKEMFPETTDDFFAPWNDWFRSNHFFNKMTLPALNIAEEQDGYKVTVAAPGLQKGDFHIAIDNDLLKISAGNESEHEEQKKKYRRKEYNYSGFSRSFTLPTDVNADAIDASYDNGILTLELPKNDKAKNAVKKKIEVK